MAPDERTLPRSLDYASSLGLRSARLGGLEKLGNLLGPTFSPFRGARVRGQTARVALTLG